MKPEVSSRNHQPVSQGSLLIGSSTHPPRCQCMPIKRYVSWALATAFLCLCGATIFCETMRAQAEAAALQLHQARWDCLTLESGKARRCRALNERHSEDADYCPEAVSACKTAGAYRNVELADEHHSKWDRITRSLRLALLVATASLIIWISSLPRNRRELLPPAR